MNELQATSPMQSQYMIKCVKSGNTAEAFYAFLFDREFWAQRDQAAQFSDLAMAITKLEAIANDEIGDGLFISLKEQLDGDVAALYVVRTDDDAIMHSIAYMDDSAKAPASSQDSDAFQLKVVREGQDDVYINVDEDANINLTVNKEEATLYGHINLVRQIIQQLQDATIGEIGVDHESVESADTALEQSDGWSQLKLHLCRRPADYTEEVPQDADGSPSKGLWWYEKVVLEIVDVNREETVETHLLRTVVKISEAHHFTVRIVREPMADLWLTADGQTSEDYVPDEALIVSMNEGVELLRSLMEMSDVKDLAQGEEPLPFQALKSQLVRGSEEVWAELIDIEDQKAVGSVYLKQPFYMEEVKL
jgi:hypothetical protein